MKRFLVAIGLSLIVFASVASAQQSGRYSVEDLLKIRRVGDPQLSPDGKRVAFTIGDVNVDANRTLTQIYIISSAGGEMRQLTSGTSSSSSPRWSPDGKKIAYVTGDQVWVMEPDGSNKEQVTKISTGAGGPVWSPDGNWFAFVSDVLTRSCAASISARVEPSLVLVSSSLILASFSSMTFLLCSLSLASSTSAPSATARRRA